MNPVDIEAIRDTLREATRYAESQPETCREMVTEAMVAIDDASWEFGGFVVVTHVLERLHSNLDIGRHWVFVDPEVTRGYLLGAVFELGVLKSAMEKEQGEQT